MIPALSPVIPETPAVTEFELDWVAWDELKLRQARLGTTEEEPDDHRCACELAHRINNQIAAWLLRASFASTRSEPPQLAGTWARRLGLRVERSRPEAVLVPTT